MPATGDSLGPYQVGARIGRGGMGEVFRRTVRVSAATSPSLSK